MGEILTDHPSRAVLDYWVDEVGPEGWYRQSDDLDAEIERRFGELCMKAQSGDLTHWQGHPEKALALVILLDQFPRNIYRDDARAFASDSKARSVARYAIDRGWDLRAAEPQRQFFYLPFMHAETLPDQDRGVRLIKERMPQTGESNLLHARAHREVIRRFGRFPHRNAALGRKTNETETSFLEEGGYGKVVEDLKAA